MTTSRTAGFPDHFSAAAAGYARFRPGYPAALFDFLAACAPHRHLAWDAGTGSGQAAVELSRRFARVVATDASPEQLARAPRLKGVEYRYEPAEATSLEDRSVDLVTAAAAVHWFDLDRFYAEVRRVLRPGGILAVWAYHFPRVSPRIDELVTGFSHDVLGPSWPHGTQYVLDQYRSLPFPFIPVAAPQTHILLDWTLAQLTGFIRSWSAVLAARRATGADPVDQLLPALAAAWGDPDRPREVLCPLFLRVGAVLSTS